MCVYIYIKDVEKYWYEIGGIEQKLNENASQQFGFGFGLWYELHKRIPSEKVRVKERNRETEKKNGKKHTNKMIESNKNALFIVSTKW